MNLETKDVQIIDFEDQLRVYDVPDDNSIRKMQQQMKAIKSFLKEYTVDIEDISQ